MSTTRQPAVGIDIQGPDAVVVIEAARGGNVRTERVPLERVSSHLPPGARVGVTLPLRESVGRWLETPLSSPAKARKVLPTVLDIQLPFALEDCEYGFVSERKGEDGKIEALAVAARHQAIEAILSRWQVLGVDPERVDHEGLALWAQALNEVPVSRDSAAVLRAIVYAGADRGCIALGRGREFINSHTFELDNPDRLRRLLRAAFGDATSAVEWVWCGPRADDSAFADARSDIEAIAPGPGLIVDAPAAFLARALCARTTGSGPLRCNFRSGPYANPRRAEASSRVLNRVTMAMLLVGAVLWGNTMLARVQSARALRTSQDHFYALYHEVAGGPPNGAQGEQAITVARRALDARRAGTAALETLLSPSLTQPLYEVITAADPAAVQIHEYRLSATEWHLVGHADDREAVSRFEDIARAAGHEVSLQWGDRTPASDADDFVLTTREAP